MGEYFLKSKCTLNRKYLSSLKWKVILITQDKDITLKPQLCILCKMFSEIQTLTKSPFVETFSQNFKTSKLVKYFLIKHSKYLYTIQSNM